MLSDPKVNQRGGGVSHIDGREKGSVTTFSLRSSEKKTYGTAFWRIMSQKFHCVCVCFMYI
jgi:hypothetical protein